MSCPEYIGKKKDFHLSCKLEFPKVQDKNYGKMPVKSLCGVEDI